MTQLDETQAPVKKGYRTYVLVLLTLVYAFNFVDRQIIGILSPFIKEDLGLDDAQLGFLKGLAFAIFYTIMGIPIAWLADRYNRVTIVSISLALWSLFTALSGKASNYTTLALARIGVGVGEAGGSPPSHSIISNLYAPEERSRALAIYALGIPIGIMLAYFASAGIIFGMVTGKISAAASPWRMVMLAVGLPGIVLAVLLRLTVREPVRPVVAPSPKAEAAITSMPSFWFAIVLFVTTVTALIATILAFEPITSLKIAGYGLAKLMLWGGMGLLSLTLVWLVFVKNVAPNVKTLLSIPAWWGMCFGIAFASFAGYALSGWLIDYIVRAFPDMLLSGPLLDQLPEHGVGRLLIVLGLINGILYTAGIWIGGVLADRWGAKNKAAYALVPAFGLILAIPFLIAIFWLKSLALLLGAMAIYLVLTGFYLGPSFAIAQTLAPVKVRATSTALFFFVLNMIALGGGPTFIGILSKNLTESHGETVALRLSMTSLVVALVISVICFLFAAWRLPKDWAAAQARNQAVD